MNDLKPIEPECLCIVIKAEIRQRLGRQVTAVENIGPDEDMPNEDSWTIEGTPEPPPKGDKYWVIEESALMRIDGDPDEEIEVNKEIECVE